MESMEHDFMGRGYLLPPGCKDLIDAMKFNAMQPSDFAHVLELSKLKLSPQQVKQSINTWNKYHKAIQLLWSKQPFPKQPFPKQSFPKQPASWPPVVGEIVIPEKTSASQLAALLGQETFQIVGDILELGCLAFSNEPLSFEIISKVARKHGFFAIKAAY